MYPPPIKQIRVLIFTRIIKENIEQDIQLVVQFQKHTFSSSLLHPLLIFIQLLVVKYLWGSSYSLFSLFIIIMFYKVMADTELTNTEWFIALRKNARLVFWELLVTIFPLTNQCITFFYKCFCLKRPCLICIVNSVALKSQQQLYNSCLKEVI